MAYTTPMASAYVTGVDLNRDGIPDVLQQNSATVNDSAARVSVSKHEIQKDIVLDVPETHYLHITTRVPKIEERLVATDYEVTSTKIIETPNIAHEWKREEVVKEVARTTVREILTPRFVPQYEEEKSIVEVPVIVPRGGRDPRLEAELRTLRAQAAVLERSRVDMFAQLQRGRAYSRQLESSILALRLKLEITTTKTVDRSFDATKTVVRSRSPMLHCNTGGMTMGMGREVSSYVVGGVDLNREGIQTMSQQISTTSMGGAYVIGSGLNREGIRTMTQQISSTPMASAYVTGVDLNRDGIPDVLQQ